MAIPLEVLETAHRLRRELLGTATEETAPMSAWDSTVLRRICEVCGADKVRELEVHHREERMTANAAGLLPDGTSMNARRNLVVLCETCHNKHHAGHIEVGPVKQTSVGPVREMPVEQTPIKDKGVSLASYAYKPRGLTEEQLEVVRTYLRKYPNCPPARLVFDLKQKEGIEVTVQKLKVIRGTSS
jgi:5-methylcytosine-specific restriction endonuclease McrA